MRWLKDFKDYKESIVIDMGIAKVGDLLESLSVWHDTLLKSVGAEELDMFNTLDLKKNDYETKMLDLDYLCGGGEKDPDERFVNALTAKKWKKSEVQNTEDYETFLNKPCKFMFIYNEESNELENPIYLMLQTWIANGNNGNGEWSEVKLYKFNGESKRFYDKLSSKTIEVVDGDENYIYTTSNGNEWTLKNSEKESDVWKKVFRKDELQDLVDQRNVSITII
jgi:hypothetical protein